MLHTTYRELEVPGARLRYRDAGAGRAIVFVHGWPLDLDLWEPQAPLAGELRMVSYDRRGFGLSGGQPSLGDDVADLGSLIAALGLESPLLVGMSQGARVVLEFALRHAGIVSGLVLDGAPPLAGNDETDGSDLPVAEFRRIAGQDGLEAFRHAWRAHPVAKLANPDARMQALLDRILARYPGNDLRAPAAPAADPIDALRLAKILVPCLVVNGALDSESRLRAGAALHDALRASEYVVVPDAGHFPNLDAPRVYNQLISAFARRLLPVAA
jgi:3-oxoadipate enol-lactonase